MEVSEILKIIKKRAKTYKGDSGILILIMDDIEKLQKKQMGGEMTMLGERNFLLITEGVKCEGSFDPSKILFIFEERLYVHEGEMVEEFLQWVVDGDWIPFHGSYQPTRAFGRGNYEERFQEFLKSR